MNRTWAFSIVQVHYSSYGATCKCGTCKAWTLFWCRALLQRIYHRSSSIFTDRIFNYASHTPCVISWPRWHCHVASGSDWEELAVLSDIVGCDVVFTWHFLLKMAEVQSTNHRLVIIGLNLWAKSTGLFKMIARVLTTCHTQYTSFSRCKPMWFPNMGLRQGSGLCSSSSRKYPGTEGCYMLQ